MNADPRRPEKILRYVSKTNGNGQEELAPDYTNTSGQYQAAGNVPEPSEVSANAETILQPAPGLEEPQQAIDDPSTSTNATNVIATSPQYGVAIISNSTTAGDLPSETVTVPTETLTDSTAKATEDKELHSTPSRNDRFKVVKIASLEPFKRGRWKCMDYVDEAPPAGATRVPQSAGSIQLTAGQYMQTQSLPQQQIQQMLLQSGFTNGTQFFTNVPPQMVPSGQYFYPQVGNMQSQTLPQVQSNIPAQFIGNQPYFPAGVVQSAAAFALPPGFQNVQYVPANLIPNQGSAFVPTSSVQVSQNFQQAQSYPTQAQSNSAQPMVNGHAYHPQGEQVAASLPAQTVKSVLLNSGGGGGAQPIVSQTQVSQQNIQNHVPPGTEYVKTATVPIIQSQQYHQTTVFQQNVQQQPPQTQNPSQAAGTGVGAASAQPMNQSPQLGQGGPAHLQTLVDQQTLANNVYTNPQFAMSVNSLTALEADGGGGGGQPADASDANSAADAATSESADDPAKTNPVVNAIDNKIEQAMDLVKSHLMYTVREEVEVLKEKIAELMEKIQQLETENNFLRSQIPKAQAVPPTAAAAPTATSGQSSAAASGAAAPPSQTGTPVANPSHNPVGGGGGSNVSTQQLPPSSSDGGGGSGVSSALQQQ